MGEREWSSGREGGHMAGPFVAFRGGAEEGMRGRQGGHTAESFVGWWGLPAFSPEPPLSSCPWLHGNTKPQGTTARTSTHSEGGRHGKEDGREWLPPHPRPKPRHAQQAPEQASTTPQYQRNKRRTNTSDCHLTKRVKGPKSHGLVRQWKRRQRRGGEEEGEGDGEEEGEEEGEEG